MGGGFSLPEVDLKGKTAVVTGANVGLGLATAKDLARRGAKVILAGRSPQRCEEAIQKIKAELGDSVTLDYIPLDLGSLKSVREFAETFKQKNEHLHILINNAGVMAIPTRETTEDGFEKQIGTNHFGHFLLTNLLLDVIKTSAPARIVNLSSVGHKYQNLQFDDLMLEKNSYSPWLAYGNSKLANILFTKELARRLEGTQVDVNAVHPGYVQTELARGVSGVAGSAIRGFGAWLFAKTPEEGAKTQILVAISPNLKGVTGKYFVDGREKAPSAAACNPESAKKLWEISEKLTGLSKE